MPILVAHVLSRSITARKPCVKRVMGDLEVCQARGAHVAAGASPMHPRVASPHQLLWPSVRLRARKLPRTLSMLETLCH
jgi:hypothetical protein